jgi:CheY-like chemotaxis protein
LGIFSIQERLRLLNAECKLRSEPGRGTRVEIIIPVRAVVPELKGQGGSVRQLHTNGGDGNRIGERPVKVLLVDDHKIVREGIANILKGKARFDVVAQAEDGLDAVEKMNTYHPDVVIMDVNMPRLNGIEATRRIKQAHPEVKVIGLSVLGENSVVESMKKAGAITLLNKAGDPKELIDLLLTCAPK